jgi:hypothetical protein
MHLSRYAETHYKFRLPCSPLHRRLPEIIVDAPSLALPGRDVPLWACVHDAHRFPATLRAVRVVVRGGGTMHKVERTLDRRLDQPFHWIELPWPGSEIPGENLVDVVLEVEDSRGRRHRFLNHDLPGLPPRSLSVLRLSRAFPFPDGWTSGDLHVHTTWSEDPVEWGGDPEVLRSAADCMGLGFWAATDHSYDFAWSHPDWMVPADPVERFAKFRATLPPDEPGRSVVLPAEEVSCGNSEGRNVHLLLVDHPDYLPGQGDGGRRWLRNRPDLSIRQVLSEASMAGSPAFAAHPRPGIGLLEKLVFRRGEWGSDDLLDGLRGLQFWNGEPRDDFRRGRALWVSDLLRGGRRLPIAGNDAHGDLNRATQVATPLLSLRETRSHRFGRARTWIHLDEPPTRSSVKAALHHGAPTVLSDGPWLSLRLPGARDPVERGPEPRVEARSLPEFGELSTLRVFCQRAQSPREELVLDAKPSALEGSDRFELPSGATYARAEATTVRGHRALTRAIEPG